MRSIWRAIAIATVGALLLGGVTTGIAVAQEETDENVVFTIGSTGEPTTFNPFKIYLALEYYFMAWTYHLPITFGVEELQAVPDFVTDVEVSEDGMTFTYTVRDDVVWSDGTPMTAEDLAWTMTNYLSASAYLPVGYLRLMESIVAIDDTHAVLTSTQPTSLYAGDIPYIYAYILPAHIWSEFDRPKKFENLPNVGSGPFLIAEYQTGQFVRMIRNPEWTGDEPYIDEIIWRLFKNEDALAESLKAGEVDFAYFLAPNIFNSLLDEPNIGTEVGTIPSFSEIGLNTGSAFQDPLGDFTPHGDGHPALQDVNVRQAIRMAIDSEELVEKVMLGYGQPGDSIIPPVSVPGARWEPPPEERLGWDIPGANAMLDQAGYEDCDGDGVREMPGCGESLVLRYYVRPSEQTSVDAAPFVSAWLEDIGIRTEVTAMSSGRLGDEINAGTYDLFSWGWIPDPDPASALSWFICDERPPDGKSYGNNDAYYCNPEYDRLYQEQLTELDVARRMEIVQEMQRIFYEDAAYSVMFFEPVMQAYRTDTFEGYVSQPQPQGDLLSGYSRDAILSIRPVGAGAPGEPGEPGVAPTGPETRGISAGVWIGIGAGVVLLVVIVLLVRRRRLGEDEA